MADYAIYPFKNMRITQNYLGTTSHKPHNVFDKYLPNNYKDYPIDEGGKDGGKEPIYATFEVKVVKIYGVGTKGTNTIWVQSTQKIKCANGKTDYVVMLITHPNDADLKNLKVGQIIKKGSIITYEGMDGATGNHIHLSVGLGSIIGNGWIQNSNEKWVLNCTNGAYKPEDIFYVDKNFTKVISSNSLNFKSLPATTTTTTTKKTTTTTKKVTATTTKKTTTTTKKTTTTTKNSYKIGNYKVTKADVLSVRKGPGLSYDIKSFSELSTSAQNKILALTNKVQKKGYVKGLTFTVSEIKYADGYNWGKTPSGWVALDLCEKI